MIQEAAVTMVPPHSEVQEPLYRRLRRSREDGQTAALREARGRGGPLDQTPVRPLPDALKAKGSWRKRIDDAGYRWSKLTEDDLQELESHERTLSELIQARYGITRAEADEQVLHFIEDHLSSNL
jgi:hypothetical protein